MGSRAELRVTSNTRAVRQAPDRPVRGQRRGARTGRRAGALARYAPGSASAEAPGGLSRLG